MSHLKALYPVNKPYNNTRNPRQSMTHYEQGLRDSEKEETCYVGPFRRLGEKHLQVIWG